MKDSNSASIVCYLAQQIAEHNCIVYGTTKKFVLFVPRNNPLPPDILKQINEHKAELINFYETLN